MGVAREAKGHGLDEVMKALDEQLQESTEGELNVGMVCAVGIGDHVRSLSTGSR